MVTHPLHRQEAAPIPSLESAFFSDGGALRVSDTLSRALHGAANTCSLTSPLSSSHAAAASSEPRELGVEFL